MKLLPEQLSLLDIDPNFCSFGVSAIDSSRILTGRPYGGCGFLFRNSILNNIMVTRIDSNSSIDFALFLLTLIHL